MKVVDSASPACAGDSPEQRRDERRMLVIEDDDLSRELLGLLAIEAGFGVESAASGEEALSVLLKAPVPAAILADMQMPGICGPALAQQLRRICGAGTTLLAMSGSKVAPEEFDGYDGFLLKPFSADQLKAACDRRDGQAAADENLGAMILNEEVFGKFERGMPAGQVFGLYTLCLNDSGRRLEAMRQAMRDGDDEAYRRAAHAIKGGCGMVGATELARLASEMESAGLPPEHDDTPLVRFLAAAARLERMLNNKASGMRADAC